MTTIAATIEKLQQLDRLPHTKTTIDIDLMLEHTRALYDALLAQKYGLPDTQQPAAAAKIAQAVNAAHEEVAQSNTITAAAVELDMNLNHYLQQQEAGIADETITQPHPTTTPSIELDGNMHRYQEQQAAPAAQEQPMPLQDHNAATTAAPAQKEPAMPPPYTPPAASTGAAQPAAFYKGIPVPQHDIRKLIGINDKYQLISELFHNNKDSYETVISEINSFTDHEEALQWVKSYFAESPEWREDSYSTQIFLSLLQRFFRERN